MGLHLNSSRRALAIWTTVAAFLGFAILQPSAYGLEFPATTSLTLSSDVVDSQTGEDYLTSKFDPEIAPIEAALFSELSSSATVIQIANARREEFKCKPTVTPFLTL